MKTHLIIKPMITEKSLALATKQNCYTFQVQATAQKHQIAQLIAQLYGVTVEKIHTASLKPQLRLTGRRRLPQSRSKTKKAFVYLHEGETIDLFNIGETK